MTVGRQGWTDIGFDEFFDNVLSIQIIIKHNRSSGNIITLYILENKTKYILKNTMNIGCDSRVRRIAIYGLETPLVQPRPFNNIDDDKIDNVLKQQLTNIERYFSRVDNLDHSLELKLITSVNIFFLVFIFILYLVLNFCLIFILVINLFSCNW